MVLRGAGSFPLFLGGCCVFFSPSELLIMEFSAARADRSFVSSKAFCTGSTISGLSPVGCALERLEWITLAKLPPGPPATEVSYVLRCAYLGVCNVAGWWVGGRCKGRWAGVGFSILHHTPGED